MAEPTTLEAVINFLLETPIFETLDAQELSEVVQIMQVQRFRDGQYVFSESDDGDGWFVVFSGECQVTKENPFGADRAIAVLGEHACFGEMSILDGSGRSASVRAIGEVTALRFPRTPFQRLLAANSLGAYKLVLGMAKVLCTRQRTLTQRIGDLMPELPDTARQPLRGNLGPLLDAYTVSE